MGAASYAFIFSLLNPSMNKLFFVGLLAMSGFMALSSLIIFLYQWIPVRRRFKRLHAIYIKKVYAAEERLRRLERQERQGRIELDPPFIVLDETSSLYHEIPLVPIIERSFTNQDMQLWARRPDDPDFLSVRIGMGSRPPTFKAYASRSGITGNLPPTFVRINNRVEELVEKYSSIISPITVSLSKHGLVAITGTGNRLAQARALAYAMTCQIAYHHSPEDVRIIVLAPESQATAWELLMHLSHTVVYDPTPP